LDPDSVDVSKLRVLDVADNGLVSIHPELREVQIRARDALAARGARVEIRRFEALEESVSIWMSMVQAAGGKTFEDMLFEGKRKSFLLEFARIAVGRSVHTLPGLALAAVEKLGPLVPGLMSRWVALGHALRDELETALGDDGVMLYPSFTLAAPRHKQPLFPPIVIGFKGVRPLIGSHWSYLSILNVMLLPVTQVPLGLNADGLPLGVQVAAAHGGDHRTLAVARVLEQEFGGWVPPWEAGPNGVR
jgi:fatty acid amide hydrolase 2